MTFTTPTANNTALPRLIPTAHGSSMEKRR
jgi:hypothetical protein